MPYPYVNPPTQVTGPITNTSGNAARDTSTFDTEARAVRDVNDQIFVLDTTVTPFVSVLTSVGRTMEGKVWKQGEPLLKKETINPKFESLEDQMNGRYAKVSGTYSTGAVTITVTGAGSSPAFIFTPGDVFFNYRTGEKMLVATVASSTTITVASAGRAFGSTTAAAGADGDELFLIGSASEENSLARNVNSTLVNPPYNYTQIFRTTIAISGTANSQTLYGGPDLKYQREKKGVEHARDIERTFIQGERHVDTSGTQGKPRRTTGGVKEGIVLSQGLVQDQGGLPITAPDLEAWLREGFTYGDNNKTLMAGGVVLSAISEIARGQLRMKMGDETYGLAVNTWISPHGTVNVVKNPTFVGSLAGEALLLDMDCFRFRYMKDRDTKLRMNIQAPDMDGEVDDYLTEVGLERINMSRCALLKNVA